MLHKQDTAPSENTLSILSFNARGLELRLQEVLLLSLTFKFDVLILLETGPIDHDHCQQAFTGFKLFSQKGENKHGGVVILTRNGLRAERVQCDVPNTCIVEITSNTTLRIVGVYATDSRSWSWDDLSPILTPKCALFGDFNVDLEHDKSKGEDLLQWADSNFLTPYMPSKPTSLRSDRIIDFVFTSGFPVSIQTCEGGKSSDHKPILSSLPYISHEPSVAKNTHWKVFTMFSEFVFPFWEKQWREHDLDNTYSDYVSFLSVLIGRCTITFPANKYRIAIPPEMRSYMSLTRALFFKHRRTRDPQLQSVVATRRKLAKYELRRFLGSQLEASLAERNTASPLSLSFWSKVKRSMKSSSSSLYGLIDNGGVVAKKPERMCNIAADHYESLFKADNIYRPHPYTDAPGVIWDNC